MRLIVGDNEPQLFFLARVSPDISLPTLHPFIVSPLRTFLPSSPTNTHYAARDTNQLIATMYRVVAAAKPLQRTLVRRVSTNFNSHAGSGGSLEGYTPPTTSPANDMIAQLAAKHLDRLSLKDLIR